MGLKILYDRLKMYGFIKLIGSDDAELWIDYVPDDVKLFIQYEQDNVKQIEVYYSKKLKEFYIKTIIEICNLDTECHIELCSYKSFAIYLIDNELYNNLDDFWKKELGFSEKI